MQRNFLKKNCFNHKTVRSKTHIAKYNKLNLISIPLVAQINLKKILNQLVFSTILKSPTKCECGHTSDGFSKAQQVNSQKKILTRSSSPRKTTRSQFSSASLVSLSENVSQSIYFLLCYFLI